MPVLIGIGHKKQHGKDTIADYLVEKYGFKKTSWAERLKAGINEWHGWDDRHAYGELKEVVDPYFGYAPRKAYQDIGTNLMRNQWMSDFWVKCAMRQIQGWLDQGYSVVVPDTRFPNEAQAVREAGGQVWKVHRPSLPSNDQHESETALDGWDGWDWVITNDGTLDDLYQRAEHCLDPLKSIIG